MPDAQNSDSGVPEHERCSRCGRPYSEHSHTLEGSSNEHPRDHAFRRQPRNQFYPEGIGDRVNGWVSDVWWPDGLWDGHVPAWRKAHAY
jgi:hypothetical protein